MKTAETAEKKEESADESLKVILSAVESLVE